MTRQEEMLALRKKLLGENPEIKMAYELSPLMREAGYGKEYWEWQLDSAHREWVEKNTYKEI